MEGRGYRGLEDPDKGRRGSLVMDTVVVQGRVTGTRLWPILRGSEDGRDLGGPGESRQDNPVDGGTVGVGVQKRVGGLELCRTYLVLFWRPNTRLRRPPTRLVSVVRDSIQSQGFLGDMCR